MEIGVAEQKCYSDLGMAMAVAAEDASVVVVIAPILSAFRILATAAWFNG